MMRMTAGRLSAKPWPISGSATTRAIVTTTVPHHGAADGLMIETPRNYHAYRRTLNHVVARAAREGRVFTGDPGAADAYRHDGDVSNEWELVTLERFRRASEEARDLDHVRRSWLDRSRRSCPS